MQLSNTLVESILDQLPEQVQTEVKRFSRSSYEISEKVLTPALITKLLEHESLKGKYYLTTYKQLKGLERQLQVAANVDQVVAGGDALSQLKNFEIAKLEDGAKAITALCKKLPRYYLWSTKANAMLLFQSITYHPPRTYRDSYEPAFLQLELSSWSRGGVTRRTTSIYNKELTAIRKKARAKGKDVVTAEVLLREWGYEIPTEEMLASYDQEIQRYLSIRNNLAEQYWLRGAGTVVGGSRWSTTYRNLSEGDLRVVIDDEDDFGKHSYTITDPHAAASPDPTVPASTTELPIQPNIRVFDLNYHRMLEVSSESLEKYEYNSELIHKLVLPKHTTDLLGLLMSVMSTGANQEQVDLIRGKSGGLIVLASGTPGTGKTLSAEVYAETVKRPLYTVQCSQLGLNPEELETQLSRILQRALRYKAVLLIDEADVYIRERGDDLHHNAMVGVFLRLLEYFNGMLFMTTNRAMIVDDAIESRCIAHLKYHLPAPKDAERIWAIMKEHFKLNATDKVISAIVAKYSLSGRSIKNICRLAAFMLQGSPLTLEAVQSIMAIQNKLEHTADKHNDVEGVRS